MKSTTMYPMGDRPLQAQLMALQIAAQSLNDKMVNTEWQSSELVLHKISMHIKTSFIIQDPWKILQQR